MADFKFADDDSVTGRASDNGSNFTNVFQRELRLDRWINALMIIIEALLDMK